MSANICLISFLGLKIHFPSVQTHFIIISNTTAASSVSSTRTSHRQLEQSALRQLHFNESHLEQFLAALIPFGFSQSNCERIFLRNQNFPA